MKNKLDSLTIFFPFFNDQGTVESLINDAYTHGQKLTDDLEVIAIHGGNSKDNTHDAIKKMKEKYPSLKIIDKRDNSEGYAVIKHGIYASTKKWVFYTDGDAQYSISKDLERLVNKQLKRQVDVVNGYKVRRGDNMIRIYLGRAYAKLSKHLFNLKIRDTDCDFRLMRRSLFDNFRLESTDASILPEMIKKLELSGATFAEVPVGHYERIYGKSSYTPFSLLKEKLIGDIKLFFKFKNKRD